MNKAITVILDTLFGVGLLIKRQWAVGITLLLLFIVQIMIPVIFPYLLPVIIISLVAFPILRLIISLIYSNINSQIFMKTVVINEKEVIVE